MGTISVSIPKSAKILVKLNDKVSFADEIFATEDLSELKVDIADKLKIDPNTIFSFLKKVIGENVEKDEVLAQKKGLLRKKTVRSPKSGIISAVDHEKGTLTISYSEKNDGKRLFPKLKIKAGFAGKIEKISSDHITLNIPAGLEIPITSITGDLFGRIFYFEDEKLYFTISEDEILQKIVIIEDLKYHIAAKCEVLGALGFIVCSGQNPTDLPFAKIKDNTVLEKLFKTKRSYAAASKRDKKLIIYG